MYKKIIEIRICCRNCIHCGVHRETDVGNNARCAMELEKHSWDAMTECLGGVYTWPSIYTHYQYDGSVA